MKRKIMIGGALILLLIAIVYIARDLFFVKEKSPVNPYELDTSVLKDGDTIAATHKEVLAFSPRMKEIIAVAADTLDRIYVGGSDGVEVFGAGGNPIFRFPAGDTVRCIAIDPRGNILLGLKNELQVRDPRGKVLLKIPRPDEKCVFTSVASTGEALFAADAGNKIVYRFDPAGRLLNRIGAKDPQQGTPGFVIPSPYFDLVAMKDGSVWVVNPGLHAFEHYLPAGELTSRWEKSSEGVEGFFGCCNPGNIAVLQNGNFVTSEKGIVRVKLYTPEGNYISLVATPESFDAMTRGLDLAVDSRDRILILDPMRSKIRIFEQK